MRCYYRNGISCGANRREFEDQSVIKGKIDQIGIRPIRVSHFKGFLEGISLRKKGREKRREEEEEEEEGEEDFRYGLLWVCMDFYGFVWICEHLYEIVWYGFLNS